MLQPVVRKSVPLAQADLLDVIAADLGSFQAAQVVEDRIPIVLHGSDNHRKLVHKTWSILDMSD